MPYTQELTVPAADFDERNVCAFKRESPKSQTYIKYHQVYTTLIDQSKHTHAERGSRKWERTGTITKNIINKKSIFSKTKFIFNSPFSKHKQLN